MTSSKRKRKKAKAVGIETLPSLKELPKDESSAIDWLEDHGVIPKLRDIKCKWCGKIGARKKGKKGKQSRHAKCNNRSCNKTTNRLKETYFEGSKIGTHEALQILIMTICGYSHEQIKQALDHTNDCVTTWMDYARQLLAEDIKEHKLVIGGIDAN